MINVFVTARIIYIEKSFKLEHIIFRRFETTKDQFTKRATDYNELRGHIILRKKMLGVDS